MNRITLTKLVLYNLKYYLKSYLGIFAVVAVGSSIITGALFVGDSIRWSLLHIALNRIGWATFALPAADRSFNFDLQKRFSTRLSSILTGDINIKVISAISLSGSVSKSDNSFRANKVNVFGVKSDFFSESYAPVFSNMPPGSAVINKALADQLHIVIGDEIIARVKKPSFLSFELPLTLQESAFVGLRLRIHFIVPDNEMGNFSLQMSQIPPLNLFVHYEELAKAADMSGKANLLLCGMNKTVDTRFLDTALKEALTADDCQIEVWSPVADVIEIRSRRVFLESGVIDAAERLVDSAKWNSLIDTNPVKILTYLANLIKFNQNQTPYSLIAGAMPPLVGPELKDDEIVINQWLAEDLDAKVGDFIQVQYYLPESLSNLKEETNRFRVAQVVPLLLPWSDRTLLPEIPGLAKAESTQDWNLGFPLVYKFRKKDDDYWRDFRGTPKAFVKLTAAKKMWSNRFGDLTALRYRIKPHARDDSILTRFSNDLIKECSPAAFGFSFIPLRKNAINSASNSQDFASLFLGFSFFLIIAALMLMTLLFHLNIERRLSEIATYFAIGFNGSMVRKIFLSEAALVIIPSSIIGVVLGGFYAKMMLLGLSTIWSEAIAGVNLWLFKYEPLSALIGAVSTILSCLLVIGFTLKKLQKSTIRAVFAADGSRISSNISRENKNRLAVLVKKFSAGFIIASLLVGLGIGEAAYLVLSKQTTNAFGFFISGALLLIGSLFGLPSILRIISSNQSQSPSIFEIALRSSARNPNRSFLTAGILACGFFIIISISIFRLDEGKNPDSPQSGVGGFKLIGESSIPIIKDLNTKEGLAAYGIDKEEAGNPRFVQFRVKSGDEASCLNLAKVQRPRILGVDWRKMEGRFSFSMLPEGYIGSNGWELLESDQPIGNASADKRETKAIPEIPAIGDSASIQWSIGKKIGDTIDYEDEFGRPFKLKIVAGLDNSILQGDLIINESAFKKLFPSQDGYQFFLIDVEKQNIEKAAQTLSRAFSDYGLELTPTLRRLAQFNAVQNTYIGAFQTLGGLGILLGIIGVAIILIRNVFERQNELAILLAIGFLKQAVRKMVIIEHLFLILIGMSIGVVSALIAVAPALAGLSRTLPAGFIVLFLILSLISGYIWTAVASRYALKGNLIESLRVE
ncbi:MAG: FtsX-like permease family protein [Verrucomicrobiia bacterium]